MARQLTNTTHRGCIELCAGGGGQALGLEQAGFHHEALIELDRDACRTLRANRPEWNVLQEDVRLLDVTSTIGSRRLCLLSAGVPCPPFSLAGQQLGADDERDLFPYVLSVISMAKPRAVLIENVKGLLQNKFTAFRSAILQALADLGYTAEWRLLYARDFGVPSSGHALFS